MSQEVLQVGKIHVFFVNSLFILYMLIYCQRKLGVMSFWQLIQPHLGFQDLRLWRDYEFHDDEGRGDDR